MRVTRRSMLKGGALAGSALAMPAAAIELGKAPLVIFDSRDRKSVV